MSADSGSGIELRRGRRQTDAANADRDTHLDSPSMRRRARSQRRRRTKHATVDREYHCEAVCGDGEANEGRMSAQTTESRKDTKKQQQRNPVECVTPAVAVSVAAALDNPALRHRVRRRQTRPERRRARAPGRPHPSPAACRRRHHAVAGRAARHRRDANERPMAACERGERSRSLMALRVGPRRREAHGARRVLAEQRQSALHFAPVSPSVDENDQTRIHLVLKQLFDFDFVDRARKVVERARLGQAALRVARRARVTEAATDAPPRARARARLPASRESRRRAAQCACRWDSNKRLS